MKKGFIASTLVSFYAILVYALIIIVFFFLFRFSGEKITAEIQGKIQEVNIQTWLINYLRTDVAYENKGIKKKTTIADLLATDEIENKASYEYKLFEENSIKILSNIRDTIKNHEDSLKVCDIIIKKSTNGEEKNIGGGQFSFFSLIKTGSYGIIYDENCQTTEKELADFELYIPNKKKGNNKIAFNVEFLEKKKK